MANHDVIAMSVTIATYNRCEDLRLTLECLVKQTLPAGAQYEVLIIDNNSNDNTKNVVEEFLAPFEGKLRYLFEPTQGQSFAHNRGIREAKGEIIVLTDDDCTFDVDYLENIYSTFKKYGDAIGFVGGKCLPQWVNCSRPEWFVDMAPGWWSRDFFWAPLAILDCGDAPIVLDRSPLNEGKTRLLHGANIAVRKMLFSKHGDFDVSLPVTQDTELQLRLLRNGECGMYVPCIEVFHKISPDRLTSRHFYRWYYVRGTLLEIEEKHQERDYRVLGIMSSLILQTIKSLIGSIVTVSPTKRIYRRSHALFNIGQMRQIIRRRS